jgi:predicted 3-demethylubiquinone-9 3-methyltransferase (glyoxalase superfamily)
MPIEGEITMQQVTPCLWFDNHAEEAAEFYTSIFKNPQDHQDHPLWKRGL